MTPLTHVRLKGCRTFYAPSGPRSFSRLNSEALAGEVLLIKDPGHFAIDSGRLYVVTAAVGGDREGFQGEVFSVTLARESVRAAKFLIAGEPAEYRGSGRHRGIGADGPRLSPSTSRPQDFGGRLERVEATSLTAIASLSTAVGGARLADPSDAVLRAQALAIRSVNDQWGVSRAPAFRSCRISCGSADRSPDRWPFRWLVADDVGLGKTIEAGPILMPLMASDKVKRLLVLVPAKLVPQWQSRLKAMFDIRLQRYSSTLDSARNSFWDTATAVVASFHTLRQESGKRERVLEAEPWDLVIVDEAHHLNCDERMGDTLAYSLLAEMQQRGRINSPLFFTGTPHRGKDYGFFGLMQLLRPDLFDRDKSCSGTAAASARGSHSQ